MMRMSGTWREFLVRSLVLGGVIFGAVRLAVARDGRPGEQARDNLTVAGTLTGVTGPTVVTFRFFKGATEVVCSPAPNATIEPGPFTAEINIEGCPRALFDGSNVEIRAEFAVGGTTVRASGNVNPVPYARYADQYGTPDCPVGYERVTDGFFTADHPDRRLCNRRLNGSVRAEEVVRVGQGPTAFWIDRFESSVTATRDSADTRYGTTSDDYGDGFPDTGQWTEPRYALSVQLPLGSGNAPAAYITWFQANAACRLAGKRLPTGDEWLMAVQGTWDPGAHNGDGGECRTNLQPVTREAGGGGRCKSYWGAHDMIGNLWEWTGEWYASVGMVTSPITSPLFSSVNGQRVNTGNRDAWGSAYESDGTFNVTSTVFSTQEGQMGIPAAATRGGAWDTGPQAGAFAISLSNGPSHSGRGVGFRCVIPR